MTKYLDPSFSIHPGASKNYRDNYDAIFKKDDELGVNEDDERIVDALVKEKTPKAKKRKLPKKKPKRKPEKKRETQKATR